MPPPKRIQLSRAKGWRKPEGAVVVARPGTFGNPFTVSDAREAGHIGTTSELNKYCMRLFRRWIAGDTQFWMGKDADERRAVILRRLPELRGKDLCCWCKVLDRHGNYTACHADVLLSIANNMTCEEVRDENIRWAKGEAAR